MGFYCIAIPNEWQCFVYWLFDMSPTFDLPGASRGAKWSSCTVHEDGSGQSVTNPCGENQWYLQYSETEGNSSQSKVYKFVRIHLLHLNSKHILKVILSSFFPLFMQEISRQKKQIGRMLGTLMKSVTYPCFSYWREGWVKKFFLASAET